MQMIHGDLTNQQCNIETPTKRMKKSQINQPNTADSIVLTDQKNSSLNQIDPQQLFDKFHQIMKISEIQQNDDDDQQTKNNCYRTLNYQEQIVQKKSKKLEFTTSPDSMNKKNKIQNGKCLNGQLKIKGKQLFEVLKVQSPKKMKLSKNLQSDYIFTQDSITTTPTKRQKQNIYCQMTAKKQQPYRNLVRKE